MVIKNLEILSGMKISLRATIKKNREGERKDIRSIAIRCLKLFQIEERGRDQKVERDVSYNKWYLYQWYLCQWFLC